MSFTDPFRNIPQIDANTVIDIRIERLERAGIQFESFRQALDITLRIQEVLVALREAGHDLGSIPNIQYYVDALRWLHFEIPLVNLVSVQQISSYPEVNEDIANQFHEYSTSVESQLKGQDPYSQMNSVIAAIKTAKRYRDLLPNADKLASSFTKDIENAKSDIQTTISNSQTGAVNELSSLTDTSSRTLRELTEASIADIQKARALAEWAEFYKNLVEEYKKSVYGEVTIKGELNKPATYTGYDKEDILIITVVKIVKWFFAWLIFGVRFIWNVVTSMFVRIKCKFRSYSGKRALWFYILSAALLLQASVFILGFLKLNFLGITF